MRSFRCDCGNQVYFENDRCLRCGSGLAFDPARRALRPLREDDRTCASHESPGTCNWLVEDTEKDLCLSCGLNEAVPKLGDRRRVKLYYEVEKAKRRLLYSLLALGLPVEGRAERPDGLSFLIVADARLDGGEIDAATEPAVLTGHLAGTVTINLLEADPQLRAGMRVAMQEDYRTLLGHFRHESGHYYWERLVAERPERFRALFGDERAPYQDRLEAYYRDGPPDDWRDRYVDAYAASHPLEDFAECWAHYLHMVDTMETAADAGLALAGGRVEDPLRAPSDFERMIGQWRELAAAMNDLNRSMGLEDAYPFALPPAVVDKLRFVHELIGAGKPAGCERLG